MKLNIMRGAYRFVNCRGFGSPAVVILFINNTFIDVVLHALLLIEVAGE